MTNTNNYIPRMRTIPAAYKELKSIDPDTSFSIRAFRKFVHDNIPMVQVGNKSLINIDILNSMLYNANSIVDTPMCKHEGS